MRGPIADGYLDEVFARRAVAEAPVGRDERRAPTGAVRRPRKQAASRGESPRTRSPRSVEDAAPAYSEVSVTLEWRQADFVDFLVGTLRSAGVRKAGQQQVVRSLIDAVEDAGIDFSRVDSLDALHRAISERPAPTSLLQVPRAILDASLNLLRPHAGEKTDLGRDRVFRR